MLGQVRKIRSALAAASSASGVAQVRALTGIAAAEAPLEADVEVAAEAPSGREPLALVRGATDFGVQALNTLTIRTARFENATASPLAISSAQIPAGVFSVVTDGCGGKTLAPLATCAVTIEFGPVSAVASTATLVVKDNATAMPEQDYLLTGAGVANGNAQVVVKTGSSASALPPGSPVTFPEQSALSSFATAGERLQAIQLVNVGTTSAILDDVGIGGPDADDFILTHGQGTHGCEDATLAPGAPGQVSTANECYVSVEVKAGRYTRPLHASLDVTGTHTGGLAFDPARTDAGRSQSRLGDGGEGRRPGDLQIRHREHRPRPRRAYRGGCPGHSELRIAAAPELGAGGMCLRLRNWNPDVRGRHAACSCEDDRDGGVSGVKSRRPDHEPIDRAEPRLRSDASERREDTRDCCEVDATRRGGRATRRTSCGS